MGQDFFADLSIDQVFGAAGSNNFVADVPYTAYWGKGGNDTFTSTSEEAPVVFIGGNGDDTYILEGGSHAIVLEYGGSESTNDILILRDIPEGSWSASIIDERHLYARIGSAGTWDQDVFIADFFADSGGIDSLRFEGQFGTFQGNYTKEEIIDALIEGGAPTITWETADQSVLDGFLADNDLSIETINNYLQMVSEDTSYNLTRSPSPTVVEGLTVTTTVKTVGVEPGTEVFWSAGGTGIDSDDFSSGALTGESTVDADGKFSFSHTLANDKKTEGTETLQVKLYSDSARTQQVGTTASTTITDTSKTPLPLVHKEDGDAHASVNENLPRGQRSLIGMRYEKLNVDGHGKFESDLDSTSDTSTTTGNGNASTSSRHSLLGIELNGSSRIGGEGRFASIITHESDNEATASNGTAEVKENIYSVSVDVSDLAIQGKSSFGSYMSVGATNRADTSQSRAGVIVTDATATLNQELAPSERNITGMRFERLTTGDGATFRSELENRIDTSASGVSGNAGTLTNNSILGVGFSGTNRISGDSSVTSVLEHNSFSDAQSVHGTALAQERNSIVGVEVDNLTVQGDATFTSTVVVRAESTSGA
jgi:hypothetical protein